jgi:hypothetical protein
MAPGPVHSNVELTGIIVQFNMDVVCLQVMVEGITGKFMEGVLKSCKTLTVALSLHRLDGWETIILYVPGASVVIISATGEEIMFPPLMADHANKALVVLELPVNKRVVLPHVNVAGELITTFSGFKKLPGTSVLSLNVHPFAPVAVK